MFNYRKVIATLITFILVFIIIMSGYIYYHNFDENNNKIYNDSISKINVGQIGIDYNYTKIIFPNTVNSNSNFNIIILFNSNISIKYIYTQTSGFCVSEWSFHYGSYTENGTTQGEFIGSVAENIGILNITIKAPDHYYNGYISLHLVGNVPETVIY
ncbi:hypothetical protein FAD_1025 [Ferroplasma acidiphilum]|uniref:Uncharacterized protein n=1 Tax=Ferroplasma acidiphilum TaxID=74969 RepID=A0A1V0N487_9ARCH|nr:hypothetical protein [Ferroplasma acidiphilum]ARD84906.1 hypothetical protein FAD_1025 [Ferroplasma acidiphilum]